MATDDHGEVLEAIDRINRSDVLANSTQQKKVLAYVVQEELAGRGPSLKAYSIGVDALNKPESFDPQTDPHVRVTVGRLRKSLAQYYADQGASDKLKIAIPVRAYRPAFEHVDARLNNFVPDGKPTINSPADNIPVNENAVGETAKEPAGVTRLAVAFAAALLVALSVAYYLGDQIFSSAVDDTHITLFVENAGVSSTNPTDNSKVDAFSRDMRTMLSRNKALSVLVKEGAVRGEPDFRIENSVEGLEKTVRYSVTLINGVTDTVVWARVFNGTEDEETGIVDTITRELQTQIFGASIAALEGRDPSKLNARQLFVLATWVPGAAKNTLEWEEERISLARLAIEKDPEFGPAYSVLADKLAYLSAVDGPSNTKAKREEARQSALKARELSPTDSFSMFNVGQSLWHVGRAAESARVMERVVELDPSFGLAKFFSKLYRYSCLAAPDSVLQEAIAFDQSLAVDNPNRWVTLTWIGWLHLNREEFNLALDAEERAAQIFRIPYTVMRHAAILNQLGRLEEAEMLIAEQRPSWPNISAAHFADVTIPRLCAETPSFGKMIRFYEELNEALSRR